MEISPWHPYLPLQDLITTYHDLNPTTIDELYEEPSPLEFMRYVARNRPFVVRKGAHTFPACRKWNAAYLSQVMRDQPVNVALTPHGNADSVVRLEKSPAALFVKPLERSEPFPSVLRAIQREERDEAYEGPTRYAQTQNDNLRGEYATLFADVPASIPFARIALGAEADAVNFWLGNSRSVTALHKDNYENVYVQILGKKHFVLLPPVEAACVNERALLAATYARRDNDCAGDTLSKEELVIKVDGAGDEYVPFATWDPDAPEEHATPFSGCSRPLRVTLDEGDMLYLPALWYLLC